MIRAMVDGVATDRVALADRAFNYGDGVFETILVADGEPVWWKAHVSRLERGCVALRIEPPAAGVLLGEVRSLAEGAQHAVAKIVVSRGAQGRGYAAAAGCVATRAISLHALAHSDTAAARDGVEVRWCALRLAGQPALAGFKHLNRLEQVLARGEWSDAGIHEGLLCDRAGNVVSAVAANLFAVRDGELVSPPIIDCGVAGVTRAWVMQHACVTQRALSREDVQGADELFLTSSLRGILPIARLDGRDWIPGEMTRRLQARLWQEVPALGPRA